MNKDYLYSDDEMKLREKILPLLFSRFGKKLNEDGFPKYSSQSIYECAHDWISKGNATTFGIIKYYEAYYAKTD